MRKSLLTVAAACILAAAMSLPASAMTGHEAAVKCENTKGCFVDYGEDGSLIIFGPKGGTVVCSGPRATCTAIPIKGQAGKGNGLPGPLPGHNEVGPGAKPKQTVGRAPVASKSPDPSGNSNGPVAQKHR